jgi:membrane protease YdiL (CAAX protease family)
LFKANETRFGPTSRLEKPAPVFTPARSSFFAFTDTTIWTPVCEELTFRGLLYTSLRTRLGAVPAGTATAAAFTLMHRPDSAGAVAYFFFPAVLGSLWYERTRSLWPNIISHALDNVVVTLFLAGHSA